MKDEVFKTELKYIKEEKYREVGKKLLNLLPEYFYHVPASASGKYHPEYTLGEGGLIRHTKTAVKFAKVLLDNPSIGEKYTDQQKDLMIITLLIHDGCKLGLQQGAYDVKHPLIISQFIKDHREEVGLTEEECQFITTCVETHMGPWTKDYSGNEVLQAPQNKYQSFIHMCDFLASQKWIHVKFYKNEMLI